jgi:hypothetical protein
MILALSESILLITFFKIFRMLEPEVCFFKGDPCGAFF